LPGVQENTTADRVAGRDSEVHVVSTDVARRNRWERTAVRGPEPDRSALIIVDMQNDFLHREGSFGPMGREHPEFNIDMPFLTGTIAW
jgi:hypothetical protein